MPKPEMLLWLSDARGVYIPRDFATSFRDRAESVSGVSAEQWEILEQGPDAEYYWDVWNEVEQSAVITDDNGVKYTIRQDGDCWLIPEGMEYNESTDSFEWPSETEETDSDDN